ncbi:uncharacterized protein LOC103950723 isoform X2 [Pyrus x bretschneideri]|uniref:uncharacterized protein LOC103950723 isoform X2 n=1 Tax=Pyrus x bretschneideri TaxID=225117 RepID=UPI000511501E|nr:uncharacterized protein LOC103950723 isoform X2 [Pyrus x bretschneideri]
MEGDDHGRRASSAAKPSRLSPLAEPFSSNRSNTALPPLHTLTSVDPCASMPKLLSGINLEDDPFQLASVFSHDLLDFGENSCFSDYPSANASSDFGFIPSAANESLLDYTEHSSFGHSQASLSSNKSAALAYETLLELGKPAVTGLKPYIDNSEIVRGKFSDLNIGRDNQLDAGLFSFSAVNSAKSPAFHSPKHNAFPAVVLEPSITSTTVAPLYPVLSKNVDFKGNCSVNNYMDLHHLLSGEGKGIHCDESPIDKGNEGRAGKALSSEGIGSLLLAKSDPLITLINTSDDFSSEHLGVKEDVSLVRKLDENDSDLDSPCWKGTLASWQSPFGVSRSSSDSVENEQETRNSLNPLAPQFFPRHAKTVVNYHVSECVGDDFSSFQKSESSAVVSFSKGHEPVDESGSKSSISVYGIADQPSNDNHQVESAYALPNSECGSVLNAPVGPSKLLSTRPIMDVPTMLNVMHEMSEMLVQNWANDLDSLNEYTPDVIQHIINNLSMIQPRAGGKTPISDITLMSTPYCPNKSTELQQVECSNTGFQVTRTNALAALHELDYQNCYKGRKVNSHVFTERTLDSCPSRSGIDTEKSNDIIQMQVMGNTLRGNHLNSEELDPEALVYKKLWLEAEAELRSLKYETCVLYTQVEMGGRKLDKYKVSGKLLARDIH